MREASKSCSSDTVVPDSASQDNGYKTPTDMIQGNPRISQTNGPNESQARRRECAEFEDEMVLRDGLCSWPICAPHNDNIQVSPNNQGSPMCAAHNKPSNVAHKSNTLCGPNEAVVDLWRGRGVKMEKYRWNPDALATQSKLEAHLMDIDLNPHVFRVLARE
ncbi:hypothetical protein ACSQ67_016778 [Phaseolus vulgaris]